MPTSSSFIKQTSVNVAIIGAGPYGLSVAAHLKGQATSFRIFGIPMHSWRSHMPVGMCLKSEGFASDIYDPESSLTLAKYCRQNNLRYEDVGYPIPIETFISYGLEFQRRLVPDVEETDVISLRQAAEGFAILTANGQSLMARKVVIAAGITHFAYLPPLLKDYPSEFVTHSSQHNDMKQLRGRKVAVIGAGSSAVDIAALLHEAGVDVQLLARRRAIDFHSPTREPRRWLDRARAPRSGLGLGWRSRLCTDAPLLFHALPQALRLRAVRRHLGPAPGWFVKDKVVGRVPMHLGVRLREAVIAGGGIQLSLVQQNGTAASVAVDHVIAGTGYKVSLKRLTFLDETLRSRLRSIDDTPILKTNFESSVRGLFIVGAASANSFGPLTRFAYGAGFTARRILPSLAQPN